MATLTLKIDGEWFTDFIRNLFYAEDYSFDECKYKIINSLCLHNSITKEQEIELAESIIYGEKKFVGFNNFKLIDDLDFDLYNYSRISRPKNFEIGKGVIGILTTDGVFGECKFGGHSDMLGFIDNCHGNINGAIAFQYTDIYDYAFIDDGYKATKHQIKWFEKNKKYLSIEQKRDFEVMIRRDKDVKEIYKKLI